MEAYWDERTLMRVGLDILRGWKNISFERDTLLTDYDAGG